MSQCEHVNQIRSVTPASEGCADCLAIGDTWVHLRLCRTCGYVGCCDNSKNRHASKHFHKTGHPIISSLEPDEDWTWCYIDEEIIEIEEGGAETEDIVRGYLVIAGLYTLSTSIIWGVNTLYLLSAGLTFLEVFIANAVFTGAMALFEIPTGVLADTRGRRTSFLLSVTVLCVGTLGYVGAGMFGGGLLLFSLMSVVLGLGFTFYSGAVEAWLVDALKARGFTGHLDSIFARGSFVSGAAMLIGSIGGGLLGSIDLAIPFVVRAGLLLALFGIAYFTMHDLGFTPQASNLRELPGRMAAIAQDSMRYGWKKPSVRLLMLSGFVQSIFMAWGFYAWQPYFLELLGSELTWVSGVIAAFVALATMAGNAIVEWLTRYCGKRTTMLLWAVGFQSVAAIAVGLVGSFWLAVGFYLLSMVALGVWGPVRQAYLHESIPSSQRATVVSFDSLIASGGSMFGQLGLGQIGQSISIAMGYIVGGAALLSALPIVGKLRGLKEIEDRIVGTAGKRGACAAQGIPSVSAVNTTVSLGE